MPDVPLVPLVPDVPVVPLVPDGEDAVHDATPFTSETKYLPGPCVPSTNLNPVEDSVANMCNLAPGDAVPIPSHPLAFIVITGTL